MHGATIKIANSFVISTTRTQLTPIVYLHSPWFCLSWGFCSSTRR